MIGIIPSRLSSSRFPGKPLTPLLGMPMIGHCYCRTRLALGSRDTFVATCDKAIVDYVNSISGRAIMTSVDHANATSRTAEALIKIENDADEQIDIVVMVQGDEPLLPPKIIKKMVQSFDDPNVDVVNVMSRIHSCKTFENKDNVKVVVDCKYDALYFSRETIPSPWKGKLGAPRYMQTGVFAFRRKALFSFLQSGETPLEREESIDMNRILELGGAIRMVPTDTVFLGVDTPDDRIEAEKLLMNDSCLKKYLGMSEKS